MTLPQDVATLLAVTGVAETAYRDFTADDLSQAQTASHWRLLRGIARRDITSQASSSASPRATGTAPNDVDTLHRSAVFSPAMFDSQVPAGARDDAFMVSSSSSEFSRAGNRERSLLAMAASAAGPAAAAGSSEAGVERKGSSPSSEPVGPAPERRRESGLPRLSLRGQASEAPRQETSLASVLQRVSS